MKQVQMEAKLRSGVGKSAARKIRQGKTLIPGVLYGQGTASMNLEISQRELLQAIHTSAGTNVLVKLNIVGDSGAQQETVMIKALQRHPVNSRLLHVDFIKISLDQVLETSVPVVIIGTAPGIKEGGILEVVHRDLAIRCLPSLIPENIAVDVSSLSIGDAVNVASLPKMEGIEILVEAHEPIVHVIAPKAEEEVKPAEVVPGTEAAVAPEVQQPEVIGEKEREARRAEKQKAEKGE